MGVIFLFIVATSLVFGGAMCECPTDTIVELFQDYIKINTTTGNDLTPAVDFWRDLASQESLPFEVYEFVEGYPVVVITWPGTDPSLSSIMLNSHMDVVPADEEDGWTYPPFSGDMDENCDIYGRGTQDMKSVSIQYFEALRQLKAQEVPMLRNVYMTLMPDEENSSAYGMSSFVVSDEFKALNAGFSMDEGAPYPIPTIPVFYKDKDKWVFQVDCYGIAGHGSGFPETNSTATGKCRNVMNLLFDYRDEQYEIASTADITDAGVYTSVNLDIMEGGTAYNVIPQHVRLIYDIRLATSVTEDAMSSQLEKWVAEGGEGNTLTYISKLKLSPATIVGDSNPYWKAIKTGTERADESILAVIPPGSTDARRVRLAGIPVFGFSPMPNTPTLLHAVDERLNANTFLNGINIYKEIITELANIPEEDISEDPETYLTYTYT